MLTKSVDEVPHVFAEYSDKDLFVHARSILIDQFVAAACQCKHNQATCSDLLVEARWMTLRHQIEWKIGWALLD